MFNTCIDIFQNYFYMPFGPILSTPEKYGLRYNAYEKCFIQDHTKTKWKQVLLYNTGWGQPDGFERIPELPFEALIELVLKSDAQNTKLQVFEEESNKYGAIAVIMERHIEELIDFLERNIENEDLFSNKLYRHNLRFFCFDSNIANTNGGIGSMSYEQILNQYPSWKRISNEIKRKVYF